MRFRWRLLHLVSEPFGEEAAEQVSHAAGRKGNDQTNGLGGIRLSAGRGATEGETAERQTAQNSQGHLLQCVLLRRAGME